MHGYRIQIMDTVVKFMANLGIFSQIFEPGTKNSSLHWIILVFIVTLKAMLLSISIGTFFDHDVTNRKLYMS